MPEFSELACQNIRNPQTDLTTPHLTNSKGRHQPTAQQPESDTSARGVKEAVVLSKVPRRSHVGVHASLIDAHVVTIRLLARTVRSF